MIYNYLPKINLMKILKDFIIRHLKKSKEKIYQYNYRKKNKEKKNKYNKVYKEKNK